MSDGVSEIRVSRIGGPITVLGPGRRVALWVQGCTIGCVGCASMDTWEASEGTSWSIECLANELIAVAGNTGATGLSVSGGEPFQQAEALALLLPAVRARWQGTEPDILVFTGYAAAAAARRSPRLWSAVDIVVAGPYRADRPSAHPLLGSDNQTIEILTPLGQQRLAELALERRPVQVTMQDGRLVLVGMPDPGDLDRIRAALGERGIDLATASWTRTGGDR